VGILQAIKVAIHDRGQLDEKARDLVHYASIVAMGLHGAVEEQLKGDAIHFERWSFFATAAAVDVGTTVLARSMSEKESIRLLGYIYGDLRERFGDEATRATKNYREGTARLLAELQAEGLSMEEADAALVGSRGAWILNNTLSREIESDAEMRRAGRGHDDHAAVLPILGLAVPESARTTVHATRRGVRVERATMAAR
jgi:hypothetical protein